MSKPLLLIEMLDIETLEFKKQYGMKFKNSSIKKFDYLILLNIL